MKVICAGFSKTGTKSIAKALRVLGYNVYDVDEHWTFHMDEWIHAMETDNVPDFKVMYKGVDAVTDMPALFYYEQLFKAFPDAKVVLSTREEEQWLKSYMKTIRIFRSEATALWAICAFLFTPTGRKWARLNKNIGKKHLSETDHKKTYLEHNARVKAVIPSEKLLVYKVTQGWEPLCKFLGNDVPRMSFPQENVNSKSIPGFVRESTVGKKMFRELMFILSVTVLVLLWMCQYLMPN